MKKDFVVNSDVRDSLSSLIKDPLLEDIELKLKKPNLFYLLKIHDVEIRHSNFLTWLLDTNSNHGLNDLVLRRFLKDIFSNKSYDWIDEFTIDKLDLNHIEIRREWKNIDILLISNDFVVCIENKVKSAEHSDQLKKYKLILESSFPDLNHAFVFLTPHGRSPLDPVDAESYQTYSYHDIANILKSILDIYSNSLSQRSRIYIEDYIAVIRRDIMKDDSLNDLAKQIYYTHREAIDFIIDNKPDRLAEVAHLFTKKIVESGWILTAPNKGYARFLTPKLDKVIPRSGLYGWKNKEAFLFEIDYWPKKITFRPAISPGDDKHREILSEAIMSIEGATKPKGKQWWSYFNLKWSFDVSSERYSDEDIEKKLNDVWDDITSLVNKVEAKILSNASKFDK